MPNPLILKAQKQLRDANSEKKKLYAIPILEKRDLSAEETARISALEETVSRLTEAVANLQTVDDDDAELAESDTVPDPEMSEDRSRQTGRRSATPVIERNAPSIQTSKNSGKGYSILKSIRSAAMNHGRQDGLEAEINQELANRLGRNAQGNGFFLPLGGDPEIRELMAPRRPELRADLTTTTGSGGVFTVPELPMIELLRSKLVLTKLGCTFLTGLQGNAAIPRQSGSSTVYPLGEEAAATPSTGTLDNVPLVPNVAIIATNISALFMAQTSVDAENFVKNDIVETMARFYEYVALNGNGTNEPTGLLQNSAIQTLSAGNQGGTNGATLTYQQMVNMEALVTSQNVEGSKMAYLTNPRQRGVLKTQPKVTGSTPYPIFTWERGASDEPGVGEINSYPAFATTNIPQNLTKGTATTCSAMIFGLWSDLILASWNDSLEIFLTNPYSLQLQGGLTISMNMIYDSVVRHNQSFQEISDAL